MQNNQNNPSEYNLEEEKLFIKEVRTRIKEEIRDDRAQKLKNFPLFPKIVASLPKVTRIFLLSFDCVCSYNVIAKTYSLSQEQRAKLPHIVWETAFQNNWDALSQNISIGISVSKEVCQRIAQSFLKDMQSFLHTQKVKQIQTQSEENKKNIILLSLKKAIEKYPRIMNQRITNNDIVFRGSDGVVTPTVKNWITTYHQEMGSGSHEPFERSQFLFHNKNAVMLSQRERTVLSEILRSLDEESTLPIDINIQEIDLGTIEKTLRQESIPSFPINPSALDARSSTSSATNQITPQRNLSEQDDLFNRDYAPKSTFLPDEHPFPKKENASTATTLQPVAEKVPSFANKLSFSQHEERPKLLENSQRVSPLLSSKTPVSLPRIPTQNTRTTSFNIPSPPSFSKSSADAPKRNANRIPAKTPASPKHDYTDYYPIPNTTKRSAENIRNVPSFSSSHTFPVEKREKESPIQKNSIPTPLHSQSFSAKKSFPSRQTSPHKNHPAPPTSIQTQSNEKMPQQKTSKQKESSKKRFLIG